MKSRIARGAKAAGQAPRGKPRAPAPRIYCAGPHFNRAEQSEMAEMAASLEAASFAVYLPQRDGILFADIRREMLQGGYEPREADPLIQQAIFWLDVFQVALGCDGLVCSLNGRTPDEGAVVVAALAFAMGKPVVLYKSDSRSLMAGSDSPQVAGLGGFARVSTIPEIAYAFRQLFRARRRANSFSLPAHMKPAAAAGRRLAQALAAHPALADVVSAIVSLHRSAESRSGR